MLIERRVGERNGQVYGREVDKRDKDWIEKRKERYCKEKTQDSQDDLARGVEAEVINDPTLKPTPNFSACGDADALLNFDSKQLANLWYHRIYDERKKIEECFNKKHSAESAVTLVGALQLHSGYGLDSLYTMSLQSPENMLADTIQVAIDTGKGLEGDIEEAVCANDKQMKDRIDKYYQESKVDFKNKLIELLDKFCEPDLKLIFQKYRQGNNGIDNAVSDAFECERSELIDDPTLKPTPNFAACGDADALVSADNKKAANIMFHRTYDERKKIEDCYNKKHGTERPLTLIGALQMNSEYPSDSLYIMSLQPPEGILADTIYVAIHSGHGEKGDIEEVICGNDKEMKDRIDKYYQDRKSTKT
ncbi:Annexin A6 [Sarracenia purpurea var. burkii]